MLRSIMIRLPLFVAICGILAAAPRPSVVPPPPPAPPPPPPSRLSFRTAFDGVAADGVHCLWQGSVDGAARGTLTLALRQVEDPVAAANPVWHVESHWSVHDTADGGQRSFTADLEGMIDWKAGGVRLAGVITDGWAKGAWVEVTGRLVAGDLAGTVTISPALVRR